MLVSTLRPPKALPLFGALAALGPSTASKRGGAGGVALRAAPPALGSTLWGAPEFCRFQAGERA
eukprot:3044371-Alexandrium_andersonii.AAC.1